MDAVSLRVFVSPAEKTVPAAPRPVEGTVTVPLREILPVLVDACLTRRVWVKDFQDEPVTISADLYEVVTAYRALRRASA